MPTRPFTDIVAANGSNPVKNGTIIVATGGFRKGSSNDKYYKVYDRYVQNYPTINDIEQKYGNRFYNGIFVAGVDNGTIWGDPWSNPDIEQVNFGSLWSVLYLVVYILVV